MLNSEMVGVALLNYDGTHSSTGFAIVKAEFVLVYSESTLLSSFLRDVLLAYNFLSLEELGTHNYCELAVFRIILAQSEPYS